MTRSRYFSFPSTGTWEYSVELEESDALKIIAGKTGQKIQLADPSAVIHISTDTITLVEKTRDGARHEEFPREGTIRLLRNLVVSNAWAGV